jgi:hypothetical protein
MTFSLEALAALASILAAAATFVLAYFARQSISVATAAINNDKMERAITRTLELMTRYTQTPIQVTSTICVTPHTAASAIVQASKKIDETRGLKKLFDESPNTTDSNAHEQYRLYVESFSVVTNFYMVANQLLQQRLLNDRLFMNTFALTFTKLYNAMLVVNGEIAAMPNAKLNRLATLRTSCESYLKAASHPADRKAP